MNTDPELKKFFSHMRGFPENWHKTVLPGKKTYKDNNGSDRDTIFDDAFDWLSEFIEPDTWTLVEDEFVFKNEEDAAQFIFTFCI